MKENSIIVPLFDYFGVVETGPDSKRIITTSKNGVKLVDERLSNVLIHITKPGFYKKAVENMVNGSDKDNTKTIDTINKVLEGLHTDGAILIDEYQGTPFQGSFEEYKIIFNDSYIPLECNLSLETTTPQEGKLFNIHSRNTETVPAWAYALFVSSSQSKTLTETLEKCKTIFGFNPEAIEPLIRADLYTLLLKGYITLRYAD